MLLLQPMTGRCDNTRRSLFVKRISFLTPDASRDVSSSGFVTSQYDECGLVMGMPDGQALARAISTISQSDPLIKLLQQIRIGRMQPTDAGLHAITEAWMGTYEQALSMDGLTRFDLRRLNPGPRLAVLTQAGVLSDEHPGLISLKASYERALSRAGGE